MPSHGQQLKSPEYEDMSVQPSNGEVDLPSYDDVLAGRSGSRSNVQPSPQAQVHDELLYLAIQFNDTLIQKAQKLHRQDEKALNLLLPCIKDFLTEYSQSTLSKATLIIIPAGSISENATPCDDDLRDADDFGRVVRVFNEYEKGEPIWDGVEMVERLADHLRPRSDELPERAAASKPIPFTEAASSKKSFWRKKSPPVKAPSVRMNDRKRSDLPKVAMDVAAEEMVFRMENEMGLYETETIWVLAVRIHVNADGRSR